MSLEINSKLILTFEGMGTFPRSPPQIIQEMNIVEVEKKSKYENRVILEKTMKNVKNRHLWSQIKVQSNGQQIRSSGAP